MKAAVHLRYGPPDVVNITNVARPIPAKGEFLVRVRASTVNRTDCGFRSAVYVISRLFSGLLRPRHTILGCEYAGDVVETAPGVTCVNIGDRIFGYNEARFGGHAEYIIVRETDTFAPIPGNISYAEAAPLTEGAHYALCNLRAAKVTNGSNVLVYGATGAIGSAAVQLAVAMGATVTAVCGAPHVQLVRTLGATRVIDYMTQEFEELHGPFHLFFDAVGKRSWAFAKPLLAPRGIYVSTELGKGGGGQNPFLALLTPLLGGKRVIFPIPTISTSDMEYLRTLRTDGHFRPLIDRMVPLDDIVEAYRYAETGQKIGNIVLDVHEASGHMPVRV